MRMSRVLLAGAAVVGVAVTTSAFTAGNNVPNSVAGYGQGTVTGATVTNISYVTNSSDGTIVDAVRFTSTTNITSNTSTMTLKTTNGTVVIGTYACAVTTPWAPGATPPNLVLTCDTSAGANSGAIRRFADFDAVGLTVAQ
jgi:hypothetical protein